MIDFWLAAGLLLLAALAFLLIPLLRGRRAQAEEDRTALNVALYQERIAELAGQQAAGTLTAEQLENGRAEAARELLADTEGSGEERSSRLGRAIPLVAALLVLLVLLLLHELRKGGKSLSTRELTALVNADQAVVLDIRPAKEFASGHIVDALNIPADKLNSRMTELEKYKGKTIILVDAMGQHSGTWGGVLKKAGFNAAKLSGGIGSWRGDNLPLVK